MTDHATRQAWLDARRSGIGGSDVAAVLGLHPSRTPLDVWASKLHAVEDDDNPAMRIGRLLEPAVMQAFTEQTGLLWRPPADSERPVRRGFQIGTPDGLLIDGSGGIEAKVVTNEWAARRFGAPGTDEVPEEYWLQCHWYLDVTGTDRWFLAALLPDFDLRVYELRREPAVEAQVRERAEAWFERHIRAGVRPPATPGDRATLARAYPRQLDDVIVRAADLETVADQFVAAKDAAARASAIADECAVLLTERIGDHTGLVAGDWLATWKAQPTGEQFDLAAFRQAVRAQLPGPLQMQMEALMAPFVRTKRDARVLRVKRSKP